MPNIDFKCLKCSMMVKHGNNGMDAVGKMLDDKCLKCPTFFLAVDFRLFLFDYNGFLNS